MLATDPKKRITLNEIRIHPWILKDFNEPPISYLPKLMRVQQIDESIMRQVIALGFEDNQSNRRAILKNKNKQVMTAYQLVLSRSTAQILTPCNLETKYPLLSYEQMRSSSNDITQDKERTRTKGNSDFIDAIGNSVKLSQPQLSTG